MKDLLYQRTREAIEHNWQITEDISGRALCSFMDWNTTHDLGLQWHKIWNTRTTNVIYMEGLYHHDNKDDYKELTYLLRALSLNMILDDNNVK